MWTKRKENLKETAAAIIPTILTSLYDDVSFTFTTIVPDNVFQYKYMILQLSYMDTTH